MKKSECKCLYNVWIVLYTCIVYICMYVWDLCYVKEVTELLSLRIERESVVGWESKRENVFY